MDRSIPAQLREFSRANPVILVLRDVEAIQRHLKISNRIARDILERSSSFFRQCTNFEFFNLSEDIAAAEPQPVSLETSPSPHSQARPPAPYLALKRAERHFLKFVSLLLPNGAIPFIESAFPLASMATEERRYTYALSIPISLLLADDIDIEEIETGADAIEVVVDDLAVARQVEGLTEQRATDISQVIGRIRRNTVVPILVHVVLPTATLEDDAVRSVYLAYLNHAIRLGVEYLTVDLKLDSAHISLISSSTARSKLIGNLDWMGDDAPSWRDPRWISYYRKAQSAGCDLVRLRRRAMRFTDNLEINHLRVAVESQNGPKLPLIAYNTGDIGRNSASTNPVLTSVALEGKRGVPREHASYPQPSLTVIQANSALAQSFVYDSMKLYVFGANVSYSLSPVMHNEALKACGLPHHYEPISTDSIRSIEEFVKDPYFAGASIGLPFKVEVISLTHSLSLSARAIGAVNTLIPIRSLREDGSIPEDNLLFDGRNRAGPVRALYGDNTDWIGIRACIRRGLSPANAVRPTSCGLVIGAGGMARAAVYSMLQLGVKSIAILNRTYANAETLVRHFTTLLSRGDFPLLSNDSAAKTQFHILRSTDEPWPSAFRHPTMVVSCIPTHAIGDTPAPDLTLPPDWLSSPTGGVMVVFAYKSLSTPLLEQSRREAHRGWVTMDGLDVLPEQGFAQFELFTGKRAPRRLMRSVVFKSYTDSEGNSNLAQLQPRLRDVGQHEP